MLANLLKVEIYLDILEGHVAHYIKKKQAIIVMSQFHHKKLLQLIFSNLFSNAT